jgi:hypothetical protein
MKTSTSSPNSTNDPFSALLRGVLCKNADLLPRSFTVLRLKMPLEDESLGTTGSTTSLEPDPEGFVDRNAPLNRFATLNIVIGGVPATTMGILCQKELNRSKGNILEGVDPRWAVSLFADYAVGFITGLSVCGHQLPEFVFDVSG